MRSICNKKEYQTTPVCLPSSRPGGLGRGHPVNELEGSDSLCLSSSIYHDQSSGENPPRRMSYSDSFSLANSTLLHSTSGSINRSSPQTSCNSRSLKRDRQTNISLKSKSSEASCLEIARRNLQKQGFSSELSTRILEPQRSSTRRVYGARWSNFCDWCKSQQEDPVKATTPLIAQYLNYLFTTKKLSPRTIEGYKTAIADFLKFHSEEDFNKNSILIKLIRSFKKECPRPQNVFPKWDLAMVLNFLTQSPFEPLAQADLKFLTWKTVFLVTLAMAARASEVHALSFADLAFEDNYKFAVVQPIPEFIAKTSNQNIYVKIPALGPAVRGSHEDRLLCPVRALKVYRARTAPIRKENPNIRRLFMSFMKGFNKDICKNTLSGWIRSLIKFAYDKCPHHIIQLSSAKPHEVRALSASLAWKANLALSDILQAACWSNHSTFTSFYLKDISLIKDDLHSLGPLVAAQKVIRL